MFDPAWWVGLGASGYAVFPSGEQEIYHRRSGRGGSQSEGTGGGNSAGGGNSRRELYDGAAYAVTEAEDLRDHGFSVWADFYPFQYVALAFGYSRSVSYQYNTMFFSTHFDLVGMFRKDRN